MKFVPNSVSRNIARTILKTKKNSPHIFFVGGVAGVIGSTILACKATLQLEETLDEVHSDISQVKELSESAKKAELSYSDKDYAKDLGYVYLKSAKKLGRLYGPSILLGSASIASLAGSHIQLTRRNAALTATVATISKAFDNYRERVQGELGEKREQDIYRGITEETVTGEDGKKRIVKAVNPHGLSPYAQIFDEYNMNWRNDSEMNQFFITVQQNYFNHQLNARGHVFLNEVYDHLGFERTKEGAIVGWVRNGEGDGYIDFGMHEAYNTEFLTGREPSVWLDFNVDGVVFDKI